MVLSKEQFMELRSQGLSVDQIVKFEKKSISKIQPQKSEGPTGIKGFLSGLQKGAGKTAIGLGQLALKGYTLLPGEQPLAKQAIETGEDIKREMFTPKTISEKVGFATEQIGEFLIPTGAATKGASLGAKLAIKAPKGLKTLTKLGSGALTESAEFAGKTFLQTSGDLRETGKSAAVGATASLAIKGVSTVGRGVFKTLPEKLYSQIFKRSNDDLRMFYQSVAKGKDINPTLAKEVLDRGLVGNSKNLAVYSFKKLNDIEKVVQKTASNKTLKLPQTKAYTNLLNEIKGVLGQPLFSPLSRDASRIIKEISSTSAEKQVPIKIVLKLRRLLDGARNSSSFRLDPALSAKQETFKKASDLLRQKISDAGFKDLMNEERIFIEAIDSIVTDAVKRQNKALLGLTDVLLGGGGLATGATGGGLGLAAGVRAFQQPISLTGLGQGLYKVGKLGEKLKVPQIMKGTTKAIPPLTKEDQMDQ